VINKRAGGMGLISGRKAFQRPMKEGAEILNAIQDVYLDNDVTYCLITNYLLKITRPALMRRVVFLT
jgi:hypothetical protein